MKPVAFKESNFVIGAGNNPNTDQLPVVITENKQMSNGHPIMYIWSFIQLEPGDLELMQQRGGLWLMSCPPVTPMQVTAYHPTKELGYVPVPEQLIERLNAIQRNKDSDSSNP